MTLSLIWSEASIYRLHSSSSINFADDADKCWLMLYRVCNPEGSDVGGLDGSFGKGDWDVLWWRLRQKVLEATLCFQDQDEETAKLYPCIQMMAMDIYIYLHAVGDLDSGPSLGEEISWIGNHWPNHPTWSDTSTRWTNGYFLNRALGEAWHTFWCTLNVYKPQQLCCNRFRHGPKRIETTFFWQDNPPFNPFITTRRDGANTSLNERDKTAGHNSVHAIYVLYKLQWLRSTIDAKIIPTCLEDIYRPAWKEVMSLPDVWIMWHWWFRWHGFRP